MVQGSVGEAIRQHRPYRARPLSDITLLQKGRGLLVQGSLYRFCASAIQSVISAAAAAAAAAAAKASSRVGASTAQPGSSGTSAT
jgi:hypothetical protein